MPIQNVDAKVGLGIGLGADPIADVPVTEITAKLSRYDKADIGTAVAVTNDYDPAKDQSARISVNGVPVTQGVVNNVGDNEDGSYKVELLGAPRVLRQHTVSKSYSGTRADDLLTDVLESVGVKHTIDLSRSTQERLDSTGSGQTTTTGGAVAGAPPGGRYAVTAQFTETPAVEVLNRVTRGTGWYWFVSGTNTVCVIDAFEHTTAPVHGGVDAGTQVTRPEAPREYLIHPLKYIIDASPGPLRPPYERVVFYGSAGANSGRTHMVTENPVWGVATGGQWEPDDATDYHRDPLLTTPEMCEAAALKLLKHYQSQQTGGWVEIPGIAALRPYDVITMPDGSNGGPDMGGSQYMVQNVEHRVNNQDGFISRITVGGLLGADQTTTTSGGGTDGSPSTGGDTGGSGGGGGDDTSGDQSGGSGGGGGGDGNQTDSGDDGFLGDVVDSFPFGPILPGI